MKLANGQLEKDISEGCLKLLNIKNFNHPIKNWLE